MSHAKNRVKWCLKKAEKELEESEKHRGLVKVKPDLENAREHIKKGEHECSPPRPYYLSKPTRVCNLR